MTVAGIDRALGPSVTAAVLIDARGELFRVMAMSSRRRGDERFTIPVLSARLSLDAVQDAQITEPTYHQRVFLRRRYHLEGFGDYEAYLEEGGEGCCPSLEAFTAMTAARDGRPNVEALLQYQWQQIESSMIYSGQEPPEPPRPLTVEFLRELRAQLESEYTEVRHVAARTLEDIGAEVRGVARALRAFGVTSEEAARNIRALGSSTPPPGGYVIPEQYRPYVERLCRQDSVTFGPFHIGSAPPQHPNCRCYITAGGEFRRVGDCPQHLGPPEPRGQERADLFDERNRRIEDTIREEKERRKANRLCDANPKLPMYVPK